MDAKNFTCTVPMTHLTLPNSPILTVSGPRDAVLHTVAVLAGFPDRSYVAIRRNPMSDDGLPWLVVDHDQAESYPAFLAEVCS